MSKVGDAGAGTVDIREVTPRRRGWAWHASCFEDGGT
jgi:hypothetical protein